LGDLSLRLPRLPPVIFGTGRLFYTSDNSSVRVCTVADG
jgi:hypothetical protein